MAASHIFLGQLIVRKQTSFITIQRIAVEHSTHTKIVNRAKIYFITFLCHPSWLRLNKKQLKY